MFAKHTFMTMSFCNIAVILKLQHMPPNSMIRKRYSKSSDNIVVLYNYNDKVYCVSVSFENVCEILCVLIIIRI